MRKRLGIGMVGSGFNAKFHLQALVGVRDADVLGVWSPNRRHAEEAAALARKLGVGEAVAYGSITEMVRNPEIEALWVCGPNHTRVENFEEVAHAVRRGDGALKGVTCEKPLARNVAEARRVAKLVKDAGLLHGYLENQVFAPAIVAAREILWARGAALTGQPYLARATEEHSGPHRPWFWQGALQGGGVLNDMMCHSVMLVRHLLTRPGASYSSVKPMRVSGHIASLKWSGARYAQQLSKRMGREVNYRKHPVEDFASATIEFLTGDGSIVLGEAVTSWSFVGAGLRLSAELLGPEYSMSWNTLESGLKIFFSREVRGKSGDDLVEKLTGLLDPNETKQYKNLILDPHSRPHSRTRRADIRGLSQRQAPYDLHPQGRLLFPDGPGARYEARRVHRLHGYLYLRERQDQLRRSAGHQRSGYISRRGGCADRRGYRR